MNCRLDQGHYSKLSMLLKDLGVHCLELEQQECNVEPENDCRIKKKLIKETLRISKRKTKYFAILFVM